MQLTYEAPACLSSQTMQTFDIPACGHVKCRLVSQPAPRKTPGGMVCCAAKSTAADRARRWALTVQQIRVSRSHVSTLKLCPGADTDAAGACLMMLKGKSDPVPLLRPSIVLARWLTSFSGPT